ncbi:interleukin 19 like [Thalassophryne amazonica]|uniref:interleukin 19 like n=1 Tax=Thalassophryne amazonica TaxID=390379 RepID=UPI00147103A1|nr:interleukin 19 like [Thalassophryne amazonica]
MLCLLLLLLLLLSCLSQLVVSRSLELGSCTVTVHTHELRKYYNSIRSTAVAEDSEIGIRLLDRSVIKAVQDGETCCFMRLLLRFYVENVFSSYALAQPQDQRSSSALANAFVTIRRNIHKCLCQCHAETQAKMDTLHAEFAKLEVKKAAQKAVGELDTVLDWLEGLGQTS